jgi:hypothetical protein
MSMRLAVRLLLLLCLLLPAVAPAAEPAGARAFIERVYAGYPRRTPLSEKQYYLLFDRELRALLKKNDNYAPGEVGPLDGDPICDCQDDSGFRHSLVGIKGTATAATAKVRNLFGPPAPRQETLVTYRLVKQDGGWRIADIASPTQPSLKRWLSRELAKPH